MCNLQLKILLQYAELVLNLRTSTLLIAPPSSSQADQNKLGGPEKSPFERSPGVGREERPPIVVVVQFKQVLSLISLCLMSMNGCMLCSGYMTEELVSLEM